jgi:cytidylate kinase
MSRRLIIAIDGPSGAGKGTVARELARRLDYRHLDTGAMYRAVAWKALADGVPLDDEDAMAALAQRADLELLPTSVVIDGHDVTSAIRTPRIDRGGGRRRLGCPRCGLRLWRVSAAKGRAAVSSMEGRDIGTVVFPQADVKIYLDASPEERARRRAADPAHATSRTTAMAEVATEMAARDQSDKTRATSPLLLATDAVEIDTTALSVEEVVREGDGDRRKQKVRRVLYSSSSSSSGFLVLSP